MIRLVAIDVDGTLLDSQGRVPAPNREAIGAAIAAGVEVVLVTGRAYHFARPVAEQVGAPVTLVASNGALVKTPDGRTAVSRLLARAVAVEVLAASFPWRDDAGLVFDRDGPGQVVYERTDWSHPSRRAYYERNRAFIGRADPLETALTEDPLAVVFNNGIGRMRDLRAALAAPPIAGRVEVATTEYELRDFALVDVMARGCSKGTTLRAWASRLGIAPAEVMAVGDNLNDLEMLEYAGRPVVMGNSVPELKTRGWPVTGTHDAAGLAAAIERFVLGPG